MSQSEWKDKCLEVFALFDLLPFLGLFVGCACFDCQVMRLLIRSVPLWHVAKRSDARCSSLVGVRDNDYCKIVINMDPCKHRKSYILNVILDSWD